MENKQSAVSEWLDDNFEPSRSSSSFLEHILNDSSVLTNS